ncbi:DUF305 domain-containing protein [Limnobacter humi]|uniref:DUF305 domain-containing protein n=1 Tax=Limnobacter humi TaxID=1778671 RepID=A0ABT1WG05_9BURK|nr:DUF305 domain-containing protein [Limnobacter humi]MCQ8896309.1 DUF305 domain-containing protein [Limnobacter humi]
MHARFKPWLLALGLSCVSIPVSVQFWQAHKTSLQEQALQRTDIPFLQHMTIHHDQAITMAQIMAGKSTGMVNSLARQIEHTQRSETGMFKAWLMLWNAEPLPRHINMDWMSHNATADETLYITRCKATDGGMEGLATVAQLNELATAQPGDAQRLFVSLMIAHHESALPMLAYAAREAHTPAVRQTAQAMWAEQRKELLTLQALRNAHSAAQ